LVRTLFADSGYWIALLDVDDVLHEAAQKIPGSMDTVRILTTEMVLSEVASHFAAYGAAYRLAVVALVGAIRQANDVEVVPQTSAQFDAALLHYAHYRDKDWSAVDCASFLLMAERGLTEALAYDHHFQQAGFQALLRDY